VRLLGSALVELSGSSLDPSAETVKSMHKAKFDFFSMALAAILTCSPAPSSGQTKPEPSKLQSATPPNPSTTGTDNNTVGAAVDPNKYLIGPEDILFVKVWRETDFTMPVAVRPDGKITMPLIGEVQAAGQTPMQLTKALSELLTKYINNPDVTVFVTDVRSKKYYILGEVNRAGAFPLVTPTTILEALGNAGGFREFANTKKIKILRGDKVFNFNYNDVTRAKHLEQNIFLENGDKIIVR
jgi:polysaccharide export outer membrane protein